MDRTKTPFAAFAALVVVAGCVLAWSSGTFQAEGFYALARDIRSAAYSLFLMVATVLLAGVIRLRRNPNAAAKCRFPRWT